MFVFQLNFIFRKLKRHIKFKTLSSNGTDVGGGPVAHFTVLPSDYQQQTYCLWKRCDISSHPRAHFINTAQWKLFKTAYRSCSLKNVAPPMQTWSWLDYSVSMSLYPTTLSLSIECFKHPFEKCDLIYNLPLVPTGTHASCSERVGRKLNEYKAFC
jgi:hypothetical protein